MCVYLTSSLYYFASQLFLWHYKRIAEYLFSAMAIGVKTAGHVTGSDDDITTLLPFHQDNALKQRLSSSHIGFRFPRENDHLFG
jgi:hypothetical protein